MKKQVLLIAPTIGTGGIVSWTQKYLELASRKNYNFIHVDSSSLNKKRNRIIGGLLDLKRIYKEIRSYVNTDIVHITTSGSFGTFRDYIVARKFKSSKKILHCHYGCIPIVLKNKCRKTFLVHTMSLYEQIWVLDKKTYEMLSKIERLKGKIFLTPNAIEVPLLTGIPPKTYSNVVFVGNLVPTKGIYELIKAFDQINADINLHIVGIGSDLVIEQMKILAGRKWGNQIRYHGLLPNKEAVDFMKKNDILALPTYYPSEAFPVSILEAMSVGNLVVSTSRAAIPDMLTARDGARCGIIIEEKNVEQLKNAILYCFENPKEADAICRKAYDKVYHSYRSEIVYQLYEENYNKLFISN